MTLWVTRRRREPGQRSGRKVPSCASRDYGEPFAADLRACYDGDFYKIDPLLFSPAVVTFVNLERAARIASAQLRPGRAAAVVA